MMENDHCWDPGGGAGALPPAGGPQELCKQSPIADNCSRTINHSINCQLIIAATARQFIVRCWFHQRLPAVSVRETPRPFGLGTVTGVADRKNACENPFVLAVGFSDEMSIAAYDRWSVYDWGNIATDQLGWRTAWAWHNQHWSR